MKSRASRGTGSEGRLSMRFTKRPYGGASPSLHFSGDGLSMSTNGPCLRLSVVFYRSLIGRPSAAALVPLNRTTDKENLFPFSIRILTKWPTPLFAKPHGTLLDTFGLYCLVLEVSSDDLARPAVTVYPGRSRVWSIDGIG